MFNSKFLACLYRFDNVRIPRENLLNSVADVSPGGQYLSAIKDPDQVNICFGGIIIIISYSICLYSLFLRQ